MLRFAAVGKLPTTIQEVAKRSVLVGKNKKDSERLEREQRSGGSRSFGCFEYYITKQRKPECANLTGDPANLIA